MQFESGHRRDGQITRTSASTSLALKVSGALVHLPSADLTLLARVTAGAVLGIDAYLVTVEADVSSGVPAFYVVGLPRGAVKEARDASTPRW